MRPGVGHEQLEMLEEGGMLNVGIFLFPKVELLDFAGPYEVFSVASELHGDSLFSTFTVAEMPGEVQSVNGLRIVPDHAFAAHPPIDVLVVPGGVGTRAEMTKPAVLDWVRRGHESGRITFSVCSGARILGALGLLDGLDAVTHHEVADELRSIAPKARVVSGRRFVDQGRIMTSAGISAGIDLSLHVVELLCGADVARKTVEYLEYTPGT
jgi:transcriptional regulator GlxA family with amidase domain